MLLHQAGGALAQQAQLIGTGLAEGRIDTQTEMERLLGTVEFARALLEGVKVAIIGPPNVGKSTLLNALVRKERVLVHEQAGTTRDVVTETVAIDAIPFELMDCAGVRPPADAIEADAVARAKGLVQKADVILFIFDARERPTIPDGLPPLSRDKKLILVGNKRDLLKGRPTGDASGARPDVPVVYVSARQGDNIQELEAQLISPYRRWVDYCRGGGAILFDEELAERFRELYAVLRQEDSAAAHRLFLKLIGHVAP